MFFSFYVLEKRAGKLDSVGAAINPEENESIGLRRSQRNRVPCLQFWRNEHIEYERRKSGMWFHTRL